MCHFIWQDNPCSECGVLFDRRLTCCQTTSERSIIRARITRGTSRPATATDTKAPCDAQYTLMVDPAFKCQECKLIEMEPWLPVQRLQDIERQRRRDEDGRVEEFTDWEDKDDTDWVPDSDDEDY